MKTFHCQFCGHPLFFENTRCLQCDSALGFLPDRLNLAAIEPVAPDDDTLWRPRPALQGRTASHGQYRLCQNHATASLCNFMVPQADPNPLCASCRLTRVLPDLSQPDNPGRWYRLEAAKRRLFYTLGRLGLLDTAPPDGQADGPIFEFLADLPGQPVITGHADGLVTINVSEADDAERMKRRLEMHEPYRTLLGHFRHESGHYYWDRLIAEGGRQDSFRERFGDERRDYQQSLQEHYARGATRDGWQQEYVSEYASSHPWEDWAETWAHYLHMVDLLETAASYNTHLALPGQGEEVEEVLNPLETASPDFDALVEQWVPLTLLVNSLNRSLGQEDAYPFALSGAALEKLRYVHDVIRDARPPAPHHAEHDRDPGAGEPAPAGGEAPHDADTAVPQA